MQSFWRHGGQVFVTVASQQAVSGFEPVGFFVEFICYVYV